MRPLLDDDGNGPALPQDVEYAFALLRGIGVVTNRRKTPREQVKKVEFPSATTRPTEKEARAALARVLRAKGPPEVFDAREDLLQELAALFDPEPSRARRKVVFKNPNQGHEDLDREMGITTFVPLTTKTDPLPARSRLKRRRRCYRVSSHSTTSTGATDKLCAHAEGIDRRKAIRRSLCCRRIAGFLLSK